MITYLISKLINTVLALVGLASIGVYVSGGDVNEVMALCQENLQPLIADFKDLAGSYISERTQ